jgi:thiamine monophosphate synthase
LDKGNLRRALPILARLLLAAGGAGVAVASGVLGAADAEAATRAYATALASRS